MVVFSPGLGGVRTQNTAWAKELASHGYVVAAVDHPRAADLRAVLSRLERLDRGEVERPLAGRLDTGRVAATGQSLGGAADLQAARQDRRFDAVVDLDGFPHGPVGDRFEQPVLALTQEIGPGTDPDYLPRLTRVLELSDTTSYRLTVPSWTPPCGAPPSTCRPASRRTGR